MAADKFGKARPDAVLVPKLQFVVGDQLVVEQVGFEQRAGVGQGWFLAHHALFQPCLHGFLAAADLGAGGFERRQETAGPENDEVRHPVGILQRDPQRAIARGRMGDQGGPVEAERIHEAQNELLAVTGTEIVGGVALAEAGEVHGDGADAARAERLQVATEHVGRRSERATMQQDGGNAATRFEVTDGETVDLGETVVAADCDIHDATLLSTRQLSDNRIASLDGDEANTHSPRRQYRVSWFVMTRSTQRFDAVIAEIDAANAADPRTVAIGGSTRPYELAYAERMSEQLLRIYPDASELLRIAARAQHIRRWDIPRTSFPQGRQGYMDWRRACREHHSQLVSEIMLRHDYGEEQTSRVAMLIKKEKLKKDKESQALENVVAVVFLDHYFEEFLASHSDYNDEKLIDIIAKTLRKMSSRGHAAALALALPERTRKLVEAAVTREAATLAKASADC